MVLEIDEERRRISLGMKQCAAQPVGRVRHELQEGRPGPGRRSSRSPISACSSGCRATSTASCTCPTSPWNDARRRSRAQVQEGRRRPKRWCSRSIRTNASASRSASSSSTAIRSRASLPPTTRTAIVQVASVRSIDARGAIVIGLEGDVEGYLRASEVLARPRRRHPHPGLQGRRRSRRRWSSTSTARTATINLSVKAKDHGRSSTEAMQKFSADNNANSGTTNLGALLKAKLNNPQ